MKTYLSACIGAEWGATVLRGDVSACKGGLVGQSESNFRKLLRDAEAVANEYNPVVLQLDKALSSINLVNCWELLIGMVMKKNVEKLFQITMIETISSRSSNPQMWYEAGSTTSRKA